MNDETIDLRRRLTLKRTLVGCAVVPLSTLLTTGRAGAGDPVKLSEDDPTAKALAYVHDASRAAEGRGDGQLCKNCNLIQSTEGTWRPCSIFPGKAVNANGWCKAWVGRG